MQILRKREEMIYPAPAACRHPTLHRLSETDQFGVHIRTLYFFKDGTASLDVLKSSLSKTLAFFYPLAGRLVERSLESESTSPPLLPANVEVDKKHSDPCHALIHASAETSEDAPRVAIGGRVDVSCLDQGALFYEAWTDSQLDTYRPDFHPCLDFDSLIPDCPQHTDIPFRVQVTHFACGGICLCVLASHNLFDGASFGHFMECWAELANGKESPTVCPYMSNHRLEVMYRPNEHNKLGLEYHPIYYHHLVEAVNGHDESKMRNKIFHFTPTFIDTLKHETSDDTCKFSTFECITAYIWKQVTLARGICSSKELSLYYSVNGRRRLLPSLPPSYLGNVVFKTHVTTRVSDLVEKPLSHTTNLIRNATSRVSDEYMRSVLKWSSEQPLPMSNRRYSSPDLFVNWWKSFPLCDLNFGWGKATCCRTSQIPFDFVIFFPSSHSKGHIEALVALTEEHMHRLSLSLS